MHLLTEIYFTGTGCNRRNTLPVVDIEDNEHGALSDDQNLGYHATFQIHIIVLMALSLEIEFLSKKQ